MAEPQLTLVGLGEPLLSLIVSQLDLDDRKVASESCRALYRAAQPTWKTLRADLGQARPVPDGVRRWSGVETVVWHRGAWEQGLGWEEWEEDWETQRAVPLAAAKRTELLTGGVIRLHMLLTEAKGGRAGSVKLVCGLPNKLSTAEAREMLLRAALLPLPHVTAEVATVLSRLQERLIEAVPVANRVRDGCWRANPELTQRVARSPSPRA